MDITITPGHLRGTIASIPSKSQAHRVLICAAFSADETQLLCPSSNHDIEATVHCLNALGANILRNRQGYLVKPIKKLPRQAVLPCGESGSTLRFMLPIVGALGVEATFLMEGRLPTRPLSPLWEELERMGCSLCRPTDNTIHCKGKLHSGAYRISGKVSSQFITGLLFAMALLDGESQLEITDYLESRPYVDLTLQVLQNFSVPVANYTVTGCRPFCSPPIYPLEGDWSNAAFFLAANALGSELTITGLSHESAQGDRAVCHILQQLQCHCTVDAADIPDLVPILSVVAAARSGAEFTNIRRLRSKESDRVCAVLKMLEVLSVKAIADENTLTVFPGEIQGGTVDSASDHRIAMSAAIAATISQGPITILGAQCVQKSYPAFWQDYLAVGGKYEQFIR